MTDRCLERENVKQLLSEAGCTEEFIGRFWAALERCDLCEALKLLRCQRCRQLERIHGEEKKLDSLDFLRYKLEKYACCTPPSGEEKAEGCCGVEPAGPEKK